MSFQIKKYMRIEILNYYYDNTNVKQILVYINSELMINQIQKQILTI